MAKKPFALIAFDIDGTLTQGLSWERFHKLAGISHTENQKWVNKYYAKEITFSQWIAYLSERYAESGRTKDEIEAISTDIPFMPGAQEAVKKIMARYDVCLVSSGIDLYVKKVANALDIATWHANCEFTFDTKGKVTGVRTKAPEEKAKVLYLTSVCEKRGIKPEDIVFIGDGMNDLAAFIYTTHGILVGKGNEQLKTASWKQATTISAIVPMLL